MSPAPIRDLALSLDPALTMELAGLTPDPWQADLLRSGRSALLLCSRQAGKSTVAASLAVHEALYRAPALVLLTAPTLRQAQELFRKVWGFQRLVGVVDPDQQSSLRLELPNGSRIVSLPGTPDNIRGFSGPSLIVVDEAAYCEDQLFFAASPMLATSGGRMVAMTTPNGQRGYFHREWRNGSDRWHRFQVTAYECSRISPEFLEQERASMPERYFRQEYLCEFLDTDDQAFASALVDAAFTSDVSPLFTSGELDNAA